MGKKTREVFRGVQMTYEQLGSSMFQNTLSMLNNAEGLALDAFSRITLVVKATVKACDKMSEEFKKNIRDPYYAKLKEAGIDWEEGQDPPSWDEEVPEEKALLDKFKELSDEQEKVLEEFRKTTVYVDCIPLGPQHVTGVKTLSAARLDALGGLYDPEGTVRHKALGSKLGVVR